MDLRVERIKNWMGNKPQPPVRIEIHPTDRCNLRCRFCWQVTNTGDYSHELSDSKIISIVEEATELGVREWIVSGGGEPFMRPRLTLELMRRIKSRGMWGQLTTNGTLISDNAVSEIVDMAWDHVQISLDAANSKDHDYLRTVNGTFERAVGTARKLARAKQKAETDKPYLGFNTTINPLNYRNLPGMIQLAHDVGFQLVYFEPVYTGYVCNERLHLNDDEKNELKRAVKGVKETAEQLGIATNIERFGREELLDKRNFRDRVLEESGRNRNPFLSLACYQPFWLMGIKGSGLAGCCSTFEIGEKIHKKTLKEVWYGELFSKIREDVLKRDMPYYCDKCSVYVVTDNRDVREKLIMSLDDEKRERKTGLLPTVKELIKRL